MFFMRYVELLDIGVFYFKIPYLVLAFSITRYFLLELSLWDTKYVSSRI